MHKPVWQNKPIRYRRFILPETIDRKGLDNSNAAIAL
jgi:hypothetical protein